MNKYELMVKFPNAAAAICLHEDMFPDFLWRLFAVKGVDDCVKALIETADEAVAIDRKVAMTVVQTQLHHPEFRAYIGLKLKEFEDKTP